MDKRRHQKLSSFMCKILRHNPEQFHLQLDDYGYGELEDLRNAIGNEAFWQDVTTEELLDIVKDCNKQRYEVEGTKIRARYGHSIPVSQKATTKKLPDYLIHGTNKTAITQILGEREGLKPMNRQYVHLSETESFAVLAAKRRGEPVLLTVDTGAAIKNGVTFHYVGNEVWLADAVPFSCLISKKDTENL